MKAKPITPYKRLLDEAREFVRNVTYRQKRVMFIYPKEKISGGSAYRLDDLAERVTAADQLDYDVQLINKDDGLNVIYVKRIPDAPWRLKP